MNIKDKNLENLLQASFDNNQSIKSLENYKITGPPLKADKNATLSDFIKMVSKICSIALKDYDIKFIPDEGKRLVQDPAHPLDEDIITYHVISRVPKIELKPRIREQFIEHGDDKPEKGIKGTTWGQTYACEIQFNIIASEYKKADEVMDIFEDIIFKYTHYFKKNGVAELIFIKHLTDENFDAYRQFVSIRNLRYKVEIEKLITVYDEGIEEILQYNN